MMPTFTSFAAFASAAVLMATSASASPLDSVAPANLRFRRAVVSVTPTSPGPGETFNEGATCTTEWTPGAGNNWKSMTISLMTGSNEAMTVLKSIVTGIDGTSLSSYSWTCPDVSPNSAIYFYQFTDKNSANPTWTTRFTIAGTDGSSTKPTNSEVSAGQTVLWGTGKLVSSSSSSGTSGTSSSSGTSPSTPSSGTSGSSGSSPDTSSSSSEPSSTTYSIIDGTTSTMADGSMTTSTLSPVSSSTTSSSASQSTSPSTDSSTTSASTTSGASSIRVASLSMTIVAITAFIIL